MERSSSFLSRLRGSLGRKQKSRLLDDVEVEGDVCTQCRTSALVAHRAAYFGHVQCLAWLANEEREKLDGVDRNGATPLMLAVRQNRMKAVQWLLTHCPHQSRQQAAGGESPVLVGAALGRLQCLQLLLEFDSKVKVSLAEDIDRSGLSAIHLASLKNRADTVTWLLKILGRSAVVHPTKSGITAVHISAAAGHLQVLELLTKKDKKGIFYVDAAGTSPLYFAAQEGRLECLRHLESIKGDPMARCDDGMTSAHCAAQGGHLHVVQWLVSTLGEHIVLAKTQEGATPVHFAAAMGHVELLEWMLSLPSVGSTAKEVQDLDGGTPAHDAADSSQLQSLIILKSHGADMTLPDTDGYTPIDLAVNSSDSNCKEWGAQMMRQASWKNTAYDGDEAEEIRDAAAAAEAHNRGSPALVPRDTAAHGAAAAGLTGLTEADRAKSGSREINIDAAVFEATKMDQHQRAGTLPAPKRTKSPPADAANDKQRESPYAIPMRLLAKTRSKTVGHRPEPSKAKSGDGVLARIRGASSSGTQEEEETSLINPAALDETDGKDDVEDPRQEEQTLDESPGLPEKTADSTILLTVEDSDMAEDKQDDESDAPAGNELETTPGKAPTQLEQVGDNKPDDAILAKLGERDVQRDGSATMPERRRAPVNIPPLSFTPELTRRVASNTEAASSPRLQLPNVTRHGLFNSSRDRAGSTTSRDRSPSPLPDARDSPLLQKRLKSTSTQPTSDLLPATTASKTEGIQQDSSDDDVKEEAKLTTGKAGSKVFTKATTVTKLLKCSSSESSSADESD